MLPTLETQRLLLRAWTASDAEDLYQYARHPAVGAGAGWKPHEDLAESRRIIQMFIDEGEVWAIRLKQTGRVVGSIGLHKDGRRPVEDVRMLGYVLSQACWGQGLMPEAAQCVLRWGFTAMGLRLISVEHYPWNQRSRRVIEKLRFTYEGTLRRACRLYDGRVEDLCMYSMNKEEWEKEQC